MLTFMKGDILESNAEALVNPVNTQGVMGKGLAFQFKNRFPNNHKLYLEKCSNNSFDIGTELVWIKENNKFVINFPTKRNWRENSKPEYIDKGLEQLKLLIEKLNIKSIAIPPIGAGNGKLDWDIVLKKLENFEKNLKDVNVIVYTPSSDISKLSREHYYIVHALLTANKSGIDKNLINDVFFQKLIFLADKNNYFQFNNDLKGPFSKFLLLKYNEVKDYSKIRKFSLLTVKKEMLKQNTSENLEKDEEYIEKGIELFLDMQKYLSLNKNDIESNRDKIELLVAILYLLRYKNSNSLSSTELFNNITSLKDIKKEKYNKKDIDEMLDFLSNENIIKFDIFGNLNYIN